MNRYASFNVFSIVYGIAYMGLFFYSEMYRQALFRYYPVTGQFSLDVLPAETAGPPILWYSWLAGALVVSLVAAAVVPRRLAEKLPSSAVWLVGLVLILAIIVYERRWFY